MVADLSSSQHLHSHNGSLLRTRSKADATDSTAFPINVLSHLVCSCQNFDVSGRKSGLTL